MTDQISENGSANNFIVEEHEDSMRLDAYLATLIDGWSRSRLQKLIENQDILVNEKPVKSSYKVHEGDVVRLAGLRCLPHHFDAFLTRWRLIGDEA